VSEGRKRAKDCCDWWGVKTQEKVNALTEIEKRAFCEKREPLFQVTWRKGKHEEIKQPGSTKEIEKLGKKGG